MNLEFQRMDLKWNAKWYHFVYYWFYNLWQKYIKKSNIYVGCCKGSATRPLKAKYTVECDFDTNSNVEIENNMVIRNIYERTIDKLIERTEQKKQKWEVEYEIHDSLICVYKTKLNDNLEFKMYRNSNIKKEYTCLFIENGNIINYCDTDNVSDEDYRKLWITIYNILPNSLHYIRNQLEEFIKAEN